MARLFLNLNPILFSNFRLAMSTTKWPSMDELNVKEAEHNRLRRIAFVAISIATTSLFASVVGIPMIYGYVQALQSQINTEIGFCRVSCFDICGYNNYFLKTFTLFSSNRTIFGQKSMQFVRPVALDDFHAMLAVKTLNRDQSECGCSANGLESMLVVMMHRRRLLNSVQIRLDRTTKDTTNKELMNLSLQLLVTSRQLQPFTSFNQPVSIEN